MCVPMPPGAVLMCRIRLRVLECAGDTVRCQVEVGGPIASHQGLNLPGTEVPLFDPGLLNQMTAGISDMASPYVAPVPSPTPAASQ